MRDGSFYNSSSPEYQYHHVAPTAVAGRRPLSAAPPVIIDDNLVCIGNTHAEILPVLPEGTTEDHMRESLKMMEGQRSSKHLDDTSSEPNSQNGNTFDELAWYNQSNLSVPPGSNKYSAYTFPPGYVRMKNHAPFSAADNPSIDEGIGGDMSTLSKPSARYHLTADTQSFLPNKTPVTILQQSSLVDQGYRTGPGPETPAFVPLSSRNPTPAGMSSRTIYHPPEVDALNVSDPSTLGVQLRSRQSSAPFTQTTSIVSGPPPIPPRELKPVLSAGSRRGLGEDVADGPVPETTTAKGGAKTHLNGALRRHGHGLSTVGVTVNGQASADRGSERGKSQTQTFPQDSDVLRSRITSAGRSGSLKTGEPRSLLAQEVSQARAARSMDFTDAAWECGFCTTINSASSKVCIMCSHSRRGRDESILSGGERRISCPKCTFANMQDKINCEMCNTSLLAG